MRKLTIAKLFDPSWGLSILITAQSLSPSLQLELLNVVGLAMGAVSVFIQLWLLRIVPNPGTTGRSALTRLLVPTSYSKLDTL